VDLNGARSGKPVNAAAIQAIIEGVPEIAGAGRWWYPPEDTIQSYLDMACAT